MEYMIFGSFILLLMNLKKEIVLQFLKTLNEEDFTAAKEFLADDFMYKGPKEKRAGAQQFISEMTNLRPKYDIRKVFNSGKTVCVIFNIRYANESQITTCGLFRVKKKKLEWLNVILDMKQKSYLAPQNHINSSSATS